MIDRGQRRAARGLFAISIALAQLTACANLPSKVEGLSPGASEWEVHDKLGQPDLLRETKSEVDPTEPVMQSWTYIDGEHTCTLRFTEQKLKGAPTCFSTDTGPWGLHREAVAQQKEQDLVEAAKAAVKKKKEEEEQKKKAEEEDEKKKPKHVMPPMQPVPGFH